MTLNAVVRKNLSILGLSVEAALDKNNVPVKVYKQLVKDINNNLDSLHRYLVLRKRMMGVETLKYSDLYTSLVKEVDLKYTYDDSTKILIQAMQPMGKEYVNALTNGINSRWADVYPTEGKRSGAYSNGSAYDVHPYLLLNHNGDYDSISTFAHEFGHSMHSWFSNKYQPYPTSDYSIFVAEVASTFNENLLNNYLVKGEKDPLKRLFFLGNLLERIRTTIFRQAMFAEFELRVHTAVEENRALTGKDFSRIYLDLVRKYYGHEKGICRVDDIYEIEWAFIPHFYYNYYVYQYATGLIASTAFAENVINGEDGVVENHFSANLLDENHHVIHGGIGQDFYWYPWVCNAPDPSPGSIKIVKESNPQTGQSFDFAGDLGAFSLYQGMAKSFSDLTAGTYNVSESNRTLLAADNWSLLSVTCREQHGYHVPPQTDLTNFSAMINMKSGQDLTCTFLNEKVYLEGDIYVIYLPSILR